MSRSRVTTIFVLPDNFVCEVKKCLKPREGTTGITVVETEEGTKTAHTVCWTLERVPNLPLASS